MLIRHPALKEERGVDWNIALYTPPSTVSRQEHYQIELHLNKWARDLAVSLNPSAFHFMSNLWT